MNVIGTADEPSRGLCGLHHITMSTPQPRKSVDRFTSPLFSPGSPSPLNDYPFPRYESSQRPNSSGRYQPRRPSTAGSVSSVGGALDTSSNSWSEAVRESGQNGLYMRFSFIGERLISPRQQSLHFYSLQLSAPDFSHILLRLHQALTEYQLLEISLP